MTVFRKSSWALGALLVPGLVWAGAQTAPSGEMSNSPSGDSSGGKDHLALRAASSRTVRVQQVEPVSQADRLRFSGSVEARQEADLTFVVAGRLVARHVDVGERVVRGQLLAQVDPAPYEHARAVSSSTLEELRARVEQLRRDETRARKLVEAKAIGVEELERVSAERSAREASLEAQDTALSEAVRQLAETRLRAPFAGTITDVLLDAGEFAAAGTPVLGLSAEDDLQVRVEVPARFVSHLKPGQEADLSFPSLGDHEVKGEIRYVGGARSGRARLFPVTVAVPEGAKAPPGTMADVLLPGETGAGFLVPVAAVMDPSGQDPFVFVVQENGAAFDVRRVPVRVLDLTGERVRVEAELASGLRVVTDGLANLIAGDRVEVLP